MSDQTETIEPAAENPVAGIDQSRGDAGLSGAVRVWVLDYFRRRSLGPSDTASVSRD